MKHPITISLAAIVLASDAFAAPPARSKQKSEGTNVQPLTYANVVSHFKAAHLRTTEVQKRCTVWLYEFGTRHSWRKSGSLSR